MVDGQPSGTVTFLFTDIEGSTRLWEEHPDEMESALALHDGILRSSIDSRRGYIFATGGDGFSAAFHRPDDAVQAALEAQRRMADESLPGGVDLRVRMGIHTGTADERGGDYFGRAPTMAARIMSAGHGGQVLVSDVTVRLAPAVETLDLGQHRLRDLGRPVQLFELGRGGASAFPPLRTLDAARGNLPLQLDSFVGRGGEVEALSTRLVDERLVTLVGVGGIGKTRLAVQTAAEISSRFADGTWLIELGQLRSPGGIEEIILATLGVGLGQGHSPRDRLVEYLSAQQALLVLDNCEHLLDAVAALVADLLQRCAAVSLLATSREPLLVEGEHLMAVGPLSVEIDDGAAAVDLFLDRTEAEGATIEAIPQTMELVQELCRRLDGMPLAIELAAARARSLDLSDIVGHLNERFRLLTGGRRSSAERHQTLRATVAWSYDLLDPIDRAVFDRLSVFAGPFNTDGASAVCSDGDIDAIAVLDALASLVDKSMCWRQTDHDGSQYRLLETLRAFGRENLTAQGGVDATSARHAEHISKEVGHLYSQVRGPAEQQAAVRFERLGAEVRAAIEWSAGFGDAELARAIARSCWPFMWRGFYTPGAWFANVAGLIDHEDWLVDWLVFQAFMSNDRARLAELVEELSGREPDGTSSRAAAWEFASFSSLTAGDLEPAMKFAQVASDASATAESRFDAVLGEFSAAAVLPAMGIDDRGPAERMIQRAQKESWITGEAFGLIGLSMNSELSHRTKAISELERAIELATSVGSGEPVGIAQMRLVLHMLDETRGKAARTATAALQHWVSSGNWMNFRATAQYTLALLAEAGRAEAAVTIHGYLDGFVGSAPLAVQARLAEAAISAIESVGDAAVALIETGRNHTNREMAEYMDAELTALAND